MTLSLNKKEKINKSYSIEKIRHVTMNGSMDTNCLGLKQ